MITGFELGPIYVEVDIDYKVWPAEAEVRYYSDGSGYPGSPPEIEILDVAVTSVSGETYKKSRMELIDGGWIDALDRLATAYVEDDVDSSYAISEAIFELEAERNDDG